MANDPYQQCVQDVMSKNVVTVYCDNTVHDTLVLLVERRLSALPVIDRQQRCLGILSATDLVGLTRKLVEELIDPKRIGEVMRQWLSEQFSEEDSGNKTVEQLMTEEVVFVGLETPLTEAADKMLQNRVHRLPVLDDERRLLGIISTMDILNAFVEGSTSSTS